MSTQFLWLSLDLSAPIGTLAIHRLEKNTPTLLSETKISDAFHHSERFLDALSDALLLLGLELSQFERFITPSGPGSFTGLRIAVASFKAFALAFEKPIDTIGSAEARAIGWLNANPGQAVKRLRVLTHASMDRYIQSVFEGATLNSEQLRTGSEVSEDTSADVTLCDERSDERLKGKLGTSEVFPMSARYLGESLLRAASRKTYATLEALINLSPEYYGATHFAEVKPHS